MVPSQNYQFQQYWDNQLARSNQTPLFNSVEQPFPDKQAGTLK
jgi:hypothetical protein